MTLLFVVQGLGDVDGDGVPDLALRAKQAGGPSSAGGVQVYSGASGTLLWERFGAFNQRLGFPMNTAGDQDGDGACDLLVGSDPTSGAPAMTVYSGRTGAVLHGFAWHRDGASPGDLDGDGWPDLFMGDRSIFTNTGRADLFSGKRLFHLPVSGGNFNALLMTWSGSYNNHSFGLTERAGDVDADGVGDLLVAATGSWPWTTADGLWVYSGRTYGLLYRVPAMSQTFPAELAPLGDVNADGFDDIAASDHSQVVVPTYYHIHVYGGPSGSPLFTLQHPAGSSNGIGSAVSGPGDVDGDGHDDILTAGWVPISEVYLFSGRNQSVLWQLQGTSRTAVGVDSGSGLGDLNGDDFPDFVITGNEFAVGTWVRVYSGAPDGVVTVGVGCPDGRGVVPRIGMSRPATRGAAFSLNLSRVRPNVPAVLVIGASSTAWSGGPLPFELTTLGLSGCWLRVSPDVATFVTTLGTAKGWFARTITVPNLPSLPGQHLYAQWLVFDPIHGASTTRALDVTVQGSTR